MSRDIYPDYHFLLIAPGLDADYFFDAARSYWETYLPTVVTSFSLIAMVPPQFSVSVTAIVRRDLVDVLEEQLESVRADTLFDPVVYDFIEDTQLALDNRASSNQPFGVPLRPTPTPTTAPTQQPVLPTPGAITTRRAPGGFITQTPTPTGYPDFVDPALFTPTPTNTPDPPDPAQPSQEPSVTDVPRQPIAPTPGAVPLGDD